MTVGVHLPFVLSAACPEGAQQDTLLEPFVMTISTEIEAFRIGPASRGIGEAQLDEAIASYNPDDDPAPLVIGHPTNDQPAHGLIAKVRREGVKLLATLKDLSDDVIQGVRSSRFINRSIAFWHPDHPSNPTPGKWNIRHLGLLGAASPGIPGMPRLAFEDGELLAFSAPADPVVFEAPEEVRIGATDAEFWAGARSAHDIANRARALIDAEHAAGRHMNIAEAVYRVTGGPA